MVQGFAPKLYVGVAAILKVGLVTAIATIVGAQLYGVDVISVSAGQRRVYPAACLIAGDIGDGSVCKYTYVVCGLSLPLSLFTSVFMCFNVNLYGVGPWLELIVEGFQTTWWLIASIVLSAKVNKTNAAMLPDGGNVPEEGWRNAVAVMAWVHLVLCGLATAILTTESGRSLFDSYGAPWLRKEPLPDHEQARGSGPTADYRAPSLPPTQPPTQPGSPSSRHPQLPMPPRTASFARVQSLQSPQLPMPPTQPGFPLTPQTIAYAPRQHPPLACPPPPPPPPSRF